MAHVLQILQRNGDQINILEGSWVQYRRVGPTLKIEPNLASNWHWQMPCVALDGHIPWRVMSTTAPMTVAAVQYVVSNAAGSFGPAGAGGSGSCPAVTI